MARFVQIEYPAHHEGVIRFTRGLEAVANLNTNHVVLATLAAIGTPVARVADAVRTGFAAWSARRQERRQDERLWNVALADARVMADLSRAMSQDAAREARSYS
jgi:hypothetical protein